LTGSRVLTSSRVFLRVEGAANDEIVIDGGNISKASSVVAFGNGARNKSVKVRA
jgi:hypothetical protein